MQTWTDNVLIAIRRICRNPKLLKKNHVHNFSVSLSDFSFSYLRERIADLTDQPSCYHAYYYANKLLVANDNKVTLIPVTTVEDPLILHIKDSEAELYAMSILTNNSATFPENVNFNQDYKIAGQIVSGFVRASEDAKKNNLSLSAMNRFMINYRYVYTQVFPILFLYYRNKICLN